MEKNCLLRNVHSYTYTINAKWIKYFCCLFEKKNLIPMQCEKLQQNLVSNKKKICIQNKSCNSQKLKNSISDKFYNKICIKMHFRCVVIFIHEGRNKKYIAIKKNIVKLHIEKRNCLLMFLIVVQSLDSFTSTASWFICWNWKRERKFSMQTLCNNILVFWLAIYSIEIINFKIKKSY